LPVPVETGGAGEITGVELAFGVDAGVEEPVEDELPLWPLDPLGASVPDFGVSREVGVEEGESELFVLERVLRSSPESPRRFFDVEESDSSVELRSLDRRALRVSLSLREVVALASGAGIPGAPGAGTPGAPPRPGKPPSGDGSALAGVPPVTGAIGLASRANVVSIAAGDRETPAKAASTMLMPTNITASTAVVRVSKSAAPRAVISPAGPPPVPSPPPSERCIRITPTSAAAIRPWRTSRKVNMSDSRKRERRHTAARTGDLVDHRQRGNTRAAPAPRAAHT
jgi:hypothetical protein